MSSPFSCLAAPGKRDCPKTRKVQPRSAPRLDPQLLHQAGCENGLILSTPNLP